MAATASPYGARPIGTLSASGSWTGKVRHYKIASAYNTNIFYGDFVLAVTDGTVAKDGGTATLTPIGIFVGCSYTDALAGKVHRQYWPADTVAADAVAYVVDDPYVLFQMQASATLAQTALFANAAVIQTAGTTAIGTSKNTLNAASIANTATLPLRIVDFVDSEFSTVGDAFTDVICKFNAGHFHLNTTGLA